jgi:hypothetical protein
MLRSLVMEANACRLRRLGGSFVVRQRATADATKFTAKIARLDIKFDRGQFNQNVLIRPVVIGVPSGLRKLHSGFHPAPWALQPLGPFVAPCHHRSIRRLSANLILKRSTIPARRIGTIELTQDLRFGYVGAFSQKHVTIRL